MPFASAQIGRSFRNEISPRAGLLRVREFTMAEIEHFVDPQDKRHEKFSQVRNVRLRVLPRDTQAAGRTDLTSITVGEAVETGVIANETLGYFVARIAQFLLRIGIDPHRLRFRQHMANEMAHYATDCWDAEIESSVGWTECVGCADRAAYDLSVHAARTGRPLVVRQALKEPIVTEQELPEFNNKALGKTFGRDLKAVTQAVSSLDEGGLLKLKGELEQGWASPLPRFPAFSVVYAPSADCVRRSSTIHADGRDFELTPELVSVKRTVVKQSSRSVAFGLGMSTNPPP